jgi:O-antigen/teichoic acid export membrane protein
MPVLLVATVFSSLVTFIGSIYTVKKRTTMSFVTAAFGAGLNIVLNFIMIPKMGAQGAGIATAISYFAVFALRALHSKKFMPFDLKALKLAFNTLAVVLQAVFMICDLPGNVLVQVLMISLIFAVNGRSLVSAAMKILKKFIKK